jgi:hypothetical protein
MTLGFESFWNDKVAKAEKIEIKEPTYSQNIPDISIFYLIKPKDDN